MKPSRTTGGLTAVLLLSAALTGCSSVTEPDQVGLYYMQGSLDGNRFDHCTEPSLTDDFEWNNQITYLPKNQRSWIVDDVEGADSGDLIVVAAKAPEGQPSGLQVRFSLKVSFVLNTNCDGTGDEAGGALRKFWESLGKRYGADTDNGWKEMLKQTFSPVLTSVTRETARDYTAEQMIYNFEGAQAKAAKTIADSFGLTLNRTAGGSFFCGPTFNRAKTECPPVEVALIAVEYNDPGIQAARNEKQKAIEQAAANKAKAEGDAAALLAAAQGQVDAAAKIAQLYKNPAWVALKKAEIQLQIAQACGQNPNCRMIMGADGNIILQP